MSSRVNAILIVSIIPYFLEKGNFWFEKNLNKILQIRKTQSFWQNNTIFCQRNQNYNFSQFLRKLDELGYEKVFQVKEPGEFAQRGGIIDVFPINTNSPYRLEFLGNEIENIEELPIKIKDETTIKKILKKKLKTQKLFSDLKGLKPGDYLVHLDHGVARYAGMREMETNQSELKFQANSKNNNKLFKPSDDSRVKSSKYYVLEYAEGDKLYIPLDLKKKLSRYVGFIEPKISRLGSQIWQKTKRKVKAEAEKLAKELLEIYARREIIKRPPYLPDDEIDSQLTADFPYEETSDQIETIEEIKKDLESNRPMDRIVCGDVGFGKTEVALRAMVKAVKSGYQSAMLCPTTILANQHFQNFKKRLKNLPIKIAILSRLQPKKEQKEIIKKLKTGKIDIIIGTHRLLSKDIENWIYSQKIANKTNPFKKGLGLLVIDDEQRFGVKQKEKLKKLRASLDVLSLSATPIPRTLYLALSSLKDISLIQTPPSGRLAVKTFILPFSEKVIKKAIEEEIKRKGQVYYLHNRIETIETSKKFLKNLVPKANFEIAHGRMSEKKLIKVMEDFQNKKIDVLVATTIIENGLDLPNVNTLIVADSTKLGLAEAYQIKGRVGRSHTQALAFFLFKGHLSKKAKIRLTALKEAEELGSGYKIALKDLEIRGAGNILGKEQSGNINQVGLNLYCQMLSEAIEKLKQTEIL